MKRRVFTDPTQPDGSIILDRHQGQPIYDEVPGPDGVSPAQRREPQLRYDGVRESDGVCVRCTPHTDCRATHWCASCDGWMCLPCWYACNVGSQPHGEAGRDWLRETVAMLETKGPQADGTVVLYCGNEAMFAHADGGGLVRSTLEWPQG
jgi:hypothetical protein